MAAACPACQEVSGKGWVDGQAGTERQRCRRADSCCSMQQSWQGQQARSHSVHAAGATHGLTYASRALVGPPLVRLAAAGTARARCSNGHQPGAPRLPCCGPSSERQRGLARKGDWEDIRHLGALASVAPWKPGCVQSSASHSRGRKGEYLEPIVANVAKPPVYRPCAVQRCEMFGLSPSPHRPFRKARNAASCPRSGRHGGSLQQLSAHVGVREQPPSIGRAGGSEAAPSVGAMHRCPRGWAAWQRLLDAIRPRQAAQRARLPWPRL